MSKIQLYQGDCLEVVKKKPDKSIDMILADLHCCIGTTNNKKTRELYGQQYDKTIFDVWDYERIKQAVIDNE